MLKSFLIVGLATLLSLGAYVTLTHNTSFSSSSTTSPTLVHPSDLHDYSYVKHFHLKVPAFNTWLAKYNKHYARTETPAKFKVWSDNYDYVQEHNAKNLSWTLDTNILADLTSEEHAALNLGFDRSKMQDYEQNIEQLDESLTATAIDWRSKGAVSAVRNQGQCGSCYSFASCAALEGLAQIKKGGKVPVFSTQQLVDCSGSYGNQGCNGGTMVASFQYTKASGVMLESAYKYTGNKGSCRSSSRYAYKNSGYKSVANSYTQLQAAVSSQVVAVAVQASSRAFQMYSSGVITSNCGNQLDHAVTAVGFSSSAWIVKNSWGGSWGMSGYVQISKGSSNVCGINQMASYPTA